MSNVVRKKMNAHVPQLLPLIDIYSSLSKLTILSFHYQIHLGFGADAHGQDSTKAAGKFVWKSCFTMAVYTSLPIVLFAQFLEVISYALSFHQTHSYDHIARISTISTTYQSVPVGMQSNLTKYHRYPS